MNDTISRQAAIEIASGCCHPANIAKELARLPSAEKKGKWIPVTSIYKATKDEFPYMRVEWVDSTEPDEIDGLRCSECGTVYDFTEARNWCSECGADMRGEQDE